MAKNKNLHIAKKNHIDEFFTRREDIENELSHYAEHFRGKVVYCNCDDPTWSEFWKFFVRVFVPWGLKKLIATHYETDAANFAYKLEIEPDANGAFDINKEPVKTPLPCNGDFRSAACIELLKEADIVVTNPPFSLFRQYVAQLVDYGKEFLVIGPMLAEKNQEFFPLIKDEKVWIGYTSPKIFRVPDGTTGDAVYIEDGITYQIFGNIQWYTNLDIPKRHITIDLRGNYYRPGAFPKYINYDAIDVNRVADIPCDYAGNIGVPLTFIKNYSPDQFELIGVAESTLGVGIGFSENLTEEECAALFRENKSFRRGNPIYRNKNGKLVKPFSRMIVRLRRPEERRYPDAD